MDTVSAIEMVYDTLDGDQDANDFGDCRGIGSMGILTQCNTRDAKNLVAAISDRVAGKVVIEIGGGVGYLAVEMARSAKHVYAIEADPAWSWVFTRYLYRDKPRNLTWIFGMAEDMVGILRGDVAVVVTMSGVAEMRALARKMASVVIMPLQEKIREMKRG